MTFLVIVFVILLILWWSAALKNRSWRRKQKMYGYFEYEYRGEVFTSRDYGPMQEIDATGAMNYRQQLGATITYQKFSPSIDDIHDLIDERQYLHEKRRQRGKFE